MGMPSCWRNTGAPIWRPSMSRRARNCCGSAEAKESQDGEVLRMIALAWLKNGFKAEALSAYEQILRRDPKNTEAIGQSAVDLAEVGLVNEAEKYMDAFVAREPEDWRTFLAFGRAFLTGGFRKQAAPWFARAVPLKPDEEEVHAGDPPGLHGYPVRDVSDGERGSTIVTV